MEEHSERLSKEPLFIQVKRSLRSYINARRPRMLPTEQELVERFAVSKTTVRKAVQCLAEEGRVKATQGRGVEVIYHGADVVHKAVMVVLRESALMEAYQKDLFAYLEGFLTERGIKAIVKILRPGNARSMEGIAHCLPQIDGVILCAPFREQELFDMLCDFRGRTVVLREESPLPYNHVLGRIDKAFELLARHLAELGHREIAYVGNQAGPRAEGVVRGLGASGLELRPENRLYSLGFRHKGYEAMGKLLEGGGRFTAAIAHNDECALGMMERLLQEGLRIPEDVSVVGYDDLLEAEHYPTPLTTCGESLNEVAREALDLILNPKPEHGDGVPEIRYLEPKLVIRKSTRAIGQHGKGV